LLEIVVRHFLSCH